MEQHDKSTELSGKRLYRSRVDRFIAGVCGGLGEYFNVDANIFRLLFIFFSIFGGAGLVLYLAALIIVPENPHQESVRVRRTNSMMFWGLLLISIGIILILRQMGFFYFLNFENFPWSIIWAVFLIGLGIVLIFSQSRTKQLPEEEINVETPEEDSPRVSIYRSRTDRMIAGVCGGLARYFNVDSSIIRLLWVLATLASIGLGVLVYIILIFVFPEEPEEQSI